MQYDYKIYKDNYPELPENIERTYDLGFLGVEKDYPEQNHPYLLKRKRTANLLYSKKSTTKNIPREG